MGLKKRWGLGCWMLVLVGVLTWGRASSQAQPNQKRAVGRETTKGKPELVMEMRFDETGRQEVVKNEVPRLRSQGKMTEFPIKAMVRQKEKKIIWFDENGGVERERVYEDAKRLIVSDDGRYHMVGHREGSYESPYDVEFYDDQGRSKWVKKIGPSIKVSPSGETLISRRYEEGDIKFITSNGEESSYSDPGEINAIAFSKNSEYILMSNRHKSGYRLLLFDKVGNLIWTSLEESYKDGSIVDIAIADDGGYTAIRHINKAKDKTKEVVVLNRKGNIIWRRESREVPFKFDFSDDNQVLAVVTSLSGNSPIYVRLFKTKTGEEIRSHEVTDLGNWKNLDVKVENNGSYRCDVNYGTNHWVYTYRSNGSIESKNKIETLASAKFKLLNDALIIDHISSIRVYNTTR